MNKKVLDFLKNLGINIDSDPILKILLKESSLTETQLETLLLEIASKFNGNNGRERIDMGFRASLRGVSKGAYARTKTQALNNIRKSICTLLLLRYIGVINDDLASLIFELADRLRERDIERSINMIRYVIECDITRTG
ncbi:MAG: hypothetical protein QXK95_02390 [Nitrososphaerota archaeon]|nr:hypothetical protein [Candidatus Geocrenenecus dongiae]